MANKEQVAMQNQVNTQTSVKRSAFGPNCSIALGSNSNQGPIRRFANGHTRTIPCEMQYVQDRKVAAIRSRQRVQTVKMVPENVEKCTQVDMAVFDLLEIFPYKKGSLPPTT